MSKTGFLQLFPKNFICAEKNFICAERQTDRQTNKQTNKQTNTLNRVANTCRSAILTVASRQKLPWVSFFVARYLTVSLRGPVLNLTARRFAPSLMGWNGVGLDGHQK